MRDVLLKRVRPLVERLANDLTELAVQRIEAAAAARRAGAGGM